MDDEIQRVFQNAGLLDELRAITTPMQGAEFVRPDGGRIIGTEFPVGADWPLGLHPSVTYYQPELEALLRDAAGRNGVDLSLGSLVALAGVVAASLAHPGQAPVIVPVAAASASRNCA